jgi:hypothetical protein
MIGGQVIVSMKKYNKMEQYKFKKYKSENFNIPLQKRIFFSCGSLRTILPGVAPESFVIDD